MVWSRGWEIANTFASPSSREEACLLSHSRGPGGYPYFDKVSEYTRPSLKMTHFNVTPQNSVSARQVFFLTFLETGVF